ncbi:hypothetical protein Slin15195_G068700 [Septoria linicola]|uniref:Uncharacterized protein n=1 Tax=Septoria linicola TaxID=215465 RepID=A0A9Q9EJ89_9PEZI|nr:hypothetical protein Slin14017_G101460 [Septoria linicola]USW53551.1 hypothetical protein Slin15195_G068700 [Septoria linicola]
MPTAMSSAKRRTTRRSTTNTTAGRDTNANTTAERDTNANTTSHITVEAAIANFREEMKIANEAFEHQEKSIRNLEEEGIAREELLWKQHNDLVRLEAVEARLHQLRQELARLRKQQRDVPYTAAEDLAGILNSANKRMFSEMMALRERNAYLEARNNYVEARNNYLERELIDARNVLEKSIPSQHALVQENGMLRQELGKKDQLIQGLFAQVEKLKEVLKEKLRRG